MTVIDGKTVVYKAEKKMRPENRLGKPIYTGETAACIEAMWRFYWYKCGNYLAEFIRQNIDFLTASRRPDFHITPDIRAQYTDTKPSITPRLFAKFALFVEFA
ncbi:MAG: hypothetical protein LBB22_03365 [Treponema sp.]|jgi:hypothetical protein|nr:hypothetical protein [Treponema sp.]